jgi:hypothetical protein
LAAEIVLLVKKPEREIEERGATHGETAKVHALDGMVKHDAPDIREHYISGDTDGSEEDEQHQVQNEKEEGEYRHK